MPQASSALAHRHDLMSNLCALIDQHGRWPVIRALFIMPKRRRLHVSGLSDHLRRDLGLTPDQRYW